MQATADLNLTVDLQSGVVPISRAASSLAALLKRSQQRQQPIILTQKGYPTGVLLSIELYSALRKLVEDYGPLTVHQSLAQADLPDGTRPQAE